jgi:hypothetical protein
MSRLQDAEGVEGVGSARGFPFPENVCNSIQPEGNFTYSKQLHFINLLVCLILRTVTVSGYGI